MARPAAFNLVTALGSVQSFDSDFVSADDLPRVSPDPAGGYAFPAYIQVDQHGRVLAVTAAPDTHFAYTDVANTFTAVPQQIDPSLAGVQWQFGSDTSDRSVRWVRSATTYSEVVGKSTGGGSPTAFLTLRTVDAGVTTAEWRMGAGGNVLTGNMLVNNQDAFSVALTVTAATGQIANLAEFYDESSALTAFLTAKGSVHVNAQAGEYGFQMFTADGLTSLFRVTNTTGEVQAAGEIGTSTGIRALAFGAYMGVSAGDRFEFQNGYIDTFITSSTGFQVRQSDAATTTASDALVLRHASSGTPAAGFGSSLSVKLQSSTTADQTAATLVTSWVVATHAGRTARSVLSVYDTAAREVMRGEASGSAPMIGFLGSAAALQQTSGANLTNNVTSGGTTDTIADITDQIVYANDAANIRNDIYQLARKLKQVNDALRLYGLLT